MTLKTLVALDFDWTVIDGDCDQAALSLLPPEVYREIKEIHYGKMQWTDLMDYTYSELHRHGRKRDEIRAVFAALPLPASMRAALQLAKQHGSADIVILSDANTIAIQECLAAHGLDTVVSAIITNVASWTPEGRLQIQRFVPADAPHGCVRMVQYLGRTMPACSLNICKGQVIRRLRVGYDRVIYLGDGKNDFCPGCELTSNDVYMPRRDRALHKILNGPDAASIRANIIYWSHADEVLQEFKALFQVVLTSQVQQ